jgi:hypothetical protein
VHCFAFEILSEGSYWVLCSYVFLGGEPQISAGLGRAFIFCLRNYYRYSGFYGLLPPRCDTSGAYSFDGRFGYQAPAYSCCAASLQYRISALLYIGTEQLRDIFCFGTWRIGDCCEPTLVLMSVRQFPRGEYGPCLNVSLLWLLLWGHS